MDAKNSMELDARNQVAHLRAELKDLFLNEKEIHPSEREAFTLKLFHFQAKYNSVYGSYIKLLGVEPKQINSIEMIPFLPVEVFQKHAVHVFPSGWEGKVQFKSSGTTGSLPSIHHIDSVDWYDEMALKGFESFFEAVHACKFLGLLPGYLERSDSSLVHMVRSFMLSSGESNPEESFFLDNWPELGQRLDRFATEGFGGNIYLIGVTHALLGWVNSLTTKSIEHWSELKIHIFETGGMKGRGPELIRPEVHRRLGKWVGRESVCSEYGMTELLSQAWSKGGGVFEPPPWMQIMIGAFDDPGEWKEPGQQGRLHVIDLANISTCSFLSTGDIGRLNQDGGFEVLGRYDHSEVRGCNLMAFNL